MKKIILIFLIITFNSNAKIDKNLNSIKLKEYETLKLFLETARDSLQNEIASRWRAKQFQIEQREHDKEEITVLREKVERSHTELSRLKEESFAKEGIIEDENKLIITKQEEWKFISSTLDEIFQKDADAIFESFPVDLENKRLDLETVRRSFKLTGRYDVSFSNFLDFKKKYIDKGFSTLFNKQTIIPDLGDPQELNYVRFGNLFAYGMNAAGETYMIRQTGSLGADKYGVDKLGVSPLNEFLLTALPEWIKEKRVNGPVMMDVLQNSQSKILISGQKISNKDKFVKWFKAGGPVMLPLFLLFAWAIILMIWKIIQFIAKSGGNKKLSKVILEHLSNNDIEGAKKFVKNRKGVVAKVVKTCLEHSKWNRVSAEKAVKEILVEELPAINKHLNTLAVIAGAAPLMGLLGTVTGMISLFEVITNYGTGDPKMLAGGISEALITTEVGLIIAIPILLVHNFLRNRTNDLQAEMEKHTIRILNRLWPEN